MRFDGLHGNIDDRMFGHVEKQKLCNRGLQHGTCEGCAFVERFGQKVREHAINLAKHHDVVIDPIDPSACAIPPEWITADGVLRTLPSYGIPLLRNDQELSAGLDGFFAVRLLRTG